MLLGAVDEAGQPMTDRELRDELLTLLFAGHETTATALCWAVDEIVRRPAIHDRIVAEAAAGTSPPVFLDATIKEVLRLRPLAVLLTRTLARPHTLGGYDLPAGTHVTPCVYLAQRHPAFWAAPAEFRPERFIDQKPSPYAWLPFGGGGRRCIGMALALYEMRLVLQTLLPQVPLRLPDPPAKVRLRSFLFSPARGPRVLVAESSRNP
jgi:cytochrome P450